MGAAASAQGPGGNDSPNRGDNSGRAEAKSDPKSPSRGAKDAKDGTGLFDLAHVATPSILSGFAVSSPTKIEGKYEGEKNNLGEKHGYGIMYYAGGDIYEGGWCNNKKDGKGIYKYSNGDVYEGEFRIGLKHGDGIYTYASGDVYIGPYVKGKRKGYGTYKFVTGAEYRGDFDNDVKDGYGVYTLPTGACYEGKIL